eukprot:TRINITY_DN11742_c0_g1_i3.p1 TRINITY_DN11742_c0_g1~~TRINITY_DN11742_c0_g1_i3.p1  ORF type:complete len:215 (-),score=24.45 TRINITY_DN11742_c0_g1_i3:67-711(-)
MSRFHNQNTTKSNPLCTITTTPTSACCIMIPLELCDEIQTIRSEHDKSFTRWDPHINLLWPFVSSGHFVQVKTIIQDVVKSKQIQPFKVRLSTFSFNQNSKYLHLNVDVIDSGRKQQQVVVKSKKKIQSPETINPLVLLYKSLVEFFPQCQNQFFEPHVTVGQIDQDMISVKCQEFQESWIPIEFTISEIHLVSRKGDGDKMKVYDVVSLTNCY